MFYINGEQIKMNSPQGRRFQTWKERVLSKMKNPVVFKSGMPIKFNPTGLIEPPKNEWIPFRATVAGENGSETWVYSAVLPRKVKDEYVFPERGRVFKHGRNWKLNSNTEAELIFFLMELSPFVKRGKIVVEDKEFEARKRIEKDIGVLDVKWYVYSEHSPISPEVTKNEDTLRMVASAWGVPNVEEMGISEVRIALVSAVESSNKNYGNTKRGFTEFISETRINDLLVLRAQIQRAIDKEVISFNQDNLTWSFKASGYVIMSVSHRDVAYKEAALYNFLRKRDDLCNKFLVEMDGLEGPKMKVVKEPEDYPDGSEDYPDKPDDTKEYPDNPMIPDDLEDVPYIDLQRLNSKYGFKSYGIRKEVLIDNLESIKP